MPEGPLGGPRPLLSEKEVSIDVMVERESLEVNSLDAKEKWASVRSDNISGEVDTNNIRVNPHGQMGFRLKEVINYTEELPLDYMNRIKREFSSALGVQEDKVSITISVTVPS